MARSAWPLRSIRPIDVAIAAWEWGKYLGHESEASGRRRVHLLLAARRAQYAACAREGRRQLSVQPAHQPGSKRLGFAEGIGLSADGTVSEGAGENLFLVKDGVLLTPSLAHSVLSGITRDTVMKLARTLGLEVREMSIPRELLYLADELFFTGTAAEITPIRTVDRLVVGSGRRGPVTEQLQQAFFGLFSLATPDQWGWLDFVDAQAPARAAAVL